jgi:hypothetical protein
MPGGRKPKYDYRSKEFLATIEDLAGKGLTDGEIACSIGMGVNRFCEKKRNYRNYRKSLRARSGVNAVVRQRYLSVGFGIPFSPGRSFVSKVNKQFPDFRRRRIFCSFPYPMWPKGYFFNTIVFSD